MAADEEEAMDDVVVADRLGRELHPEPKRYVRHVPVGMPRGSLDLLVESESHDPMAIARTQFPLPCFNVDTYEYYVLCAAHLSSMLEKILLDRGVIWDKQPSYFLPSHWNQVLRPYLDKVPQSQDFWDVFVQLARWRRLPRRFSTVVSDMISW